MRISRIIDTLHQRAFREIPAPIAYIRRFVFDKAYILHKIGTVMCALRTDTALICGPMCTRRATNVLSFAFYTELTRIVGISGASALFIIGVLFNLLGNGCPVFTQLLSDFSKDNQQQESSFSQNLSYCQPSNMQKQ